MDPGLRGKGVKPLISLSHTDVDDFTLYSCPGVFHMDSQKLSLSLYENSRMLPNHCIHCCGNENQLAALELFLLEIVMIFVLFSLSFITSPKNGEQGNRGYSIETWRFG